MLCYTSQTVFVIDGTNIHEAFIGSLSYCNFIIKPLNFPKEDSPHTQHYNNVMRSDQKDGKLFRWRNLRLESRNYLNIYWIMLAYHLDRLPYVLNPLALLGARGRRHHQRPLSVVNIEAELGSHPWLTVDNLIIIRIIITNHYTATHNTLHCTDL